MDRGLWHCTRGNDQDHPQEKEMQKRPNGCLRWPYKLLRKEQKLKAKEKRKDIPIWMQSSKEQQEEMKAFLSDKYQEIEENNRKD